MTNRYPSRDPIDYDLCHDIAEIVREHTMDGETPPLSTRHIADELGLHTKQVQDSVRKPMNIIHLSRLGVDITQTTYRSPWRWNWKPSLADAPYASAPQKWVETSGGTDG